MRRSASEFIRNLENRVARLEKQGSNDKSQLVGITPQNVYHYGGKISHSSSAMLYNPTTDKFVELVLVEKKIISLKGTIGKKGRKVVKTYDTTLDAKNKYYDQVIRLTKKNSGDKRFYSAYAEAGAGKAHSYYRDHEKGSVLYGRYPTDQNRKEVIEWHFKKGRQEALNALQGGGGLNTILSAYQILDNSSHDLDTLTQNMIDDLNPIRLGLLNRTLSEAEAEAMVSNFLRQYR
jgi:hypothetical protein